MSVKYNQQQIRSAVTALKAYREKPFVKHQWEEVVFYLSQGDDPGMRATMSRELEDIKNKNPGISVSRF
jgi:hypothetical protein